METLSRHMDSTVSGQMDQPASSAKKPGKWFKTDPYMFGVWPVKVWRDSKSMFGNDTGVRYWNTEREAWEHLLDRARKDRLMAQKALDRTNRNLAKAMKKLAPK